MKRSPAMQAFVDQFAEQVFGRTNSESIKESLCVTCGKPVGISSFRDALSRREYGISGMCQECQDSVFGS